MRDYYDVYTLLEIYGGMINQAVFRKAFQSTCEKRGTPQLSGQSEEILGNIEENDRLKQLWRSYQKKYSYAKEVTFEDTVRSVRILAGM